MKLNVVFFFFLLYGCVFAQLPDGFVYVNTFLPDLDVEIRYNTANNFVGKRIDGYKSNTLILTKETAIALKNVQEDLQCSNLCLLVYDGYRPQRAVNHFIRWAKDLNDTINKRTFYPDVDKINLFAEDYIAVRSGHSKGSTVDVTIIDGNTGMPLDMGSNYDFFGEASWVEYKNITEKQQANRRLLQEVMYKHGFKNYPKEWWHFTLNDEPFPDTYFDFPVK
jgi:zinc D-Ala-D-Ala dipeptidase